MRPISAQSLSSRSLSAIAFSAIVLLLLSVVACGPGSPEEKVTQTRGQYSVKLETWFPKVEEPAPMETEEPAEGVEGEPAEGEPTDEPSATMDSPEGDGAEGETPEGDGAVAPAEPAGPVTTDIYFDLVVLFSGSESLPGITIDVTQADASGNEKLAWREYLDTDGIVKAEARQLGFQTAVEFEEGDQFSVQLLSYVDPANYSEYKEYAEAQ